MNANGFKEYNGSLYFGAMFDERNLELWKLTAIDNTGIPVTQVTDLEVYPNPVTSSLQLKQRIDGNYNIIDISGKVVLSGRMEGIDAVQIDVSGLEHGIYILRTQSRAVKFVKE